MLEKCNICPHNCNVDRNKREKGYCKIENGMVVSKVLTHMWEEPCISGTKGTGAIFFSGCNMRCIYCQNYEISRTEENGNKMTPEELADILIQKQVEGVHTIDLVSPTPYILLIKETIKIAKNKGLIIPVIYNSNGYENVEALRELDGLIDVYLPDFKYGFDELGERYSKVKGYTNSAVNAIKEMYRQVGSLEFSKKGIIQRGVIIRHLVLPNNIENTKEVLKKIRENFEKDVYVSLMGQYVPTREAIKDNTINRKITQKEYDEVIDFFFDTGLKNGFMQELDAANEKYTPKFKENS